MPPNTARRRGRPPTISKKKISAAVKSVAHGGQEINMHAVAQALNVDVSTLYRHGTSQIELSRMFAELVAPFPDALPDPAGKTAREWLSELGWFYWKLMRTHSQLLQHSQSVTDPKYEILEYVIGVLVGYGFAPRVAAFCYNHLINSLIGIVDQQIRDEEERAQGAGRFIDFQKFLATSSDDKKKHILSCDLNFRDFESKSSFEIFLKITVDGILAQMEK